MTRRDLTDTARDGWRWDDIVIAVISIGYLVAASFGWVA